MKFVREQFFLAAAAQNIKRLVRFFRHSTTPVLPATAKPNRVKKNLAAALVAEKHVLLGYFFNTHGCW